MNKKTSVRCEIYVIWVAHEEWADQILCTLPKECHVCTSCHGLLSDYNEDKIHVTLLWLHYLDSKDIA